MDPIEDIVTRGVANIIPNREALEKTLQSEKKLNIYLGIDPTATHIHLGHAVPLRKLQQFADLGHNVTFLIGSFTALIGDTSDKDAERPILTKEQIEENFQTYKSQAEKVLDFSKITVKYNSEWLKDLNFEEIVKLAQHFSVGDFVGRELIRRRLDENKRVGLHEVLYPVMQGYDSYYLDTDVQLGGTDQTFNMQAGRELQKDLRGKESFVMTNVFLEGTDGRKMSKSWGNAIWLDDTPEDIYAKTMAIKDELIVQYFTLATNLPFNEINEYKERLDKGDHPMDIKKILASRIVSELYDKESSGKAGNYFESRVQQKEVPQDIEIKHINDISLQVKDMITTAEHLIVASGTAATYSEAKRLIDQGGIEIDGQRVTNPNDEIELKNDLLIKRGKHKFVKIKTS
jgi:tyrosyl-tRNA synthetase